MVPKPQDIRAFDHLLQGAQVLVCQLEVPMETVGCALMRGRELGGYTWRTDSRLTLASPMRLTDEQAMAFVRRVGCPTQLVVAADGMLAKHPELLSQLPFTVNTLPGGHHLHLNDEPGALLVADCFNRFFHAP